MVELAEQAQRFDAAYREYKNPIHYFGWSSHWKLDGFDPEDTRQEALAVLWKCCGSYDPNDGATFNTFFWQAARNRIGELLRAQGAKKRGKLVTIDGIILNELIDEWVMNEASPEDEYIAYDSVITKLRGTKDASNGKGTARRKRGKTKGKKAS